MACGLALTAPAAPAVELTQRLVEFRDLQGWEDDDHGAALRVFLETCPDLKAPEWAKLCAVATQGPKAKGFFEAFFQPVLIEDGEEMLFTGYYEPELEGARTPSARFAHPLYALPPEARDGQYATRREIENGGLLEGRGLELAWVSDPVAAFFLQVQGSGRIALSDGSKLRLG
ncbi:MAG: MltA domain-containing protein, partial [Pseudomonadota bacterium]